MAASATDAESDAEPGQLADDALDEVSGGNAGDAPILPGSEQGDTVHDGSAIMG